MGAAPWEGIISSGVHTISVEANGYTPMVFRGTAREGRRETIRVRLVPVDIARPPDAPDSEDDPLLLETPPLVYEETAPFAEDTLRATPPTPPPVTFTEDTGPVLPGVMTLGLMLEGGYASAKWNSAEGQTGWYGIGGCLGAALVRERVWFEMLATAKYGQHFFVKWSEELEKDNFKELRLGLQFRLLFPVKHRRLYLGFEFELGGMISHYNYFYLDFRGGLSVFPHPIFEIRFSPLGLEWVHDFQDKGRLLGWSGGLSFVLRPV